MTPLLDRLDTSQWETRKIALALRMQQLPHVGPDPSASALAADVDSIETELESGLALALGRFVAGLDQTVLSSVPHSASDIDLYNYLVHETNRRNRLQFAAAFPLFLRMAATGAPESTGGLIRRVVDAGLPLVSTLSRRWAVSPSVLRILQGQGVEAIGIHWEANLEGLVAVLNALPAEFRPGKTEEDWRAFNAYVSFAESLFGRRPWTSPLALAWLRHAAKHGWARDGSRQEGEEQPSEELALVEELRQATIDALREEDAVPAISHAEEREASARIWLVVDRYLSGMTPRRLVVNADLNLTRL